MRGCLLIGVSFKQTVISVDDYVPLSEFTKEISSFEEYPLDDWRLS